MTTEEKIQIHKNIISICTDLLNDKSIGIEEKSKVNNILIINLEGLSNEINKYKTIIN